MLSWRICKEIKAPRSSSCCWKLWTFTAVRCWEVNWNISFDEGLRLPKSSRLDGGQWMLQPHCKVALNITHSGSLRGGGSSNFVLPNAVISQVFRNHWWKLHSKGTIYFQYVSVEPQSVFKTAVRWSCKYSSGVEDVESVAKIAIHYICAGIVNPSTWGI